jgi:hypothetical protein
VEVRELSFERWRVVRQKGVYYASTPELPKLSLPLEVMSDVAPRITDWDTRKVPIKGYGLLTFQAGQVEGKDGAEEVVHAAVIDLAARTLIAIEPVRQGNRQTEWSWEETRLTVKGIDGHTEEYSLSGKPKELAQPAAPAQQPRRVTADQRPGGYSNNNGPPSWAPWAWGGGYGGSGGGGRPSRQQQQPKSLFDMLFKN